MSKCALSSITFLITSYTDLRINLCQYLTIVPCRSIAINVQKNLTSQDHETQLSVGRSEFGPNSHVLHPQSENDVGTVGDELLQEVGQHRERVPQPVRVVPA